MDYGLTDKVAVAAFISGITLYVDGAMMASVV